MPVAKEPEQCAECGWTKSICRGCGELGCMRCEDHCSGTCVGEQPDDNFFSIHDIDPDIGDR